MKVNRHKDFTKLAAISVAYNNSPDRSILPSRESLFQLLRDPTLDEGTLGLILYIISYHGPLSSDNEKTLISTTIQKFEIEHPEFSSDQEHWLLKIKDTYLLK